MKRKAYSRGERKEMILNIMYSSISDGMGALFSAYSMAKMIGLNSAQHVRNIMDEMVNEEKLTFCLVEHRPDLFKKMYCPKPLIEADWKELPTIPKVRFMGKEVK